MLSKLSYINFKRVLKVANFRPAAQGVRGFSHHIEDCNPTPVLVTGEGVTSV